MNVELGHLDSPPSPAKISELKKRPIWNLEAHVAPANREWFEASGWIVVGIVCNADGLGKHRLRMNLVLNKSFEGRTLELGLRAGD